MRKGWIGILIIQVMVLFWAGAHLVYVSFATYLTAILLIGATIDKQYYILPNIGAIALVVGGIGYGIYAHMAWWHMVVSTLVIATVTYSIRWISRGGFGWGDIKWFTASSVWLSWDGAIVAVVLSFLVGTLYLFLSGNYKRRIIPFGPFLCFSVWFVFITTSYMGGDNPWLQAYMAWMLSSKGIW